MKMKMKEMPMMEKEENESEEIEAYEIDSAVEAMLRAEEIKQDPKLFKLAMEKIRKKKDTITSLEGMREKANKMDRKDTGLEE